METRSLLSALCPRDAACAADPVTVGLIAAAALAVLLVAVLILVVAGLRRNGDERGRWGDDPWWEPGRTPRP
jgi:hypothetical protein